MARGKNSQNFLAKRKRPTNKGAAKGNNDSSEAIDVVLINKINSIEKTLNNVSLKIYQSYNKILMYIGVAVFASIFILLNYLEKKISKYTYTYENIAEIKYKTVYNGHYNYKGNESYDTLTAMKEEGRNIYFYYNLILIFVYSPILCFSITNIISEVCGFTKTNVFPFFISVFQILESIALIFTIKGYPNSLILLNISGKLAVIKYFFIFITIFVVIFGFIDRYQNKPKSTGISLEESEKSKKSE
ncbi:hypothetical protein BCR36DRAFT_580657 [Piromyces finnis]|uniref:Uncharacterized protein n=1 Tax=Piromyces finnis TaxID=1754191 RepID=A0A1Y1VJP0_9FUNG|nr:hypothetical protein BCR36DRAFT_580657 [Piromyces finnis]|eukprot:ORX57241.1 hypothetical protein BCR36DRAFT_580657 [Piromyces finnis]